MIAKCYICKKKFKTFTCLIKKGRGKYCSRECAHIGINYKPNKGSFKKGQHISPATEFKKGLIPWHAGKKFPDFTKHPHWKGGRIERSGYIMLYKNKHPSTHKQNYVYEHRLVMEKHIGRYLKSQEVVHHINGNPSDNRIKNLMLFKNNAEHKKFHKK